MNRYLSVIVILLFATSGYCQTMIPVTLEKRISLSSQIVEAKVISQRSYWNADHTLILTSNEVEVYKVFKGTSVSRVSIITLGGQVGNDMLIVEPELELHVGDVGVFLLTHSIRFDPTGHAYVPVAASLP